MPLQWETSLPERSYSAVVFRRIPSHSAQGLYFDEPRREAASTHRRLTALSSLRLIGRSDAPDPPHADNDAKLARVFTTMQWYCDVIITRATSIVKECDVSLAI